MLSEQDFDEYQLRLGLPDDGRLVVASIRTSDPARRVQSNPRSIMALYASSKMCSTRQCESGNELAGAYEYDEADDVLEFWDQPQTIRLEFENLSGRRQVVFHTPDFLVLRRNEVGFEEWKMEEQLEKLAEKYPTRYRREADGTWRCPPGEAWANPRGLYYRLRSSREINANKLRNLIFLKDYFPPHVPNVTEEARQAVLSAVKTTPGLTLEELFGKTQSVASRDDIYELITGHEVFVDIDRAPLVEPERVLVFADPQTAAAYRQILEITPSTGPTRAPFLDLAIGSTAEWNGRVLTIVNVGESTVGLLGQDQKFSEMPTTTFETLVRTGRIVAVSTRTEKDMSDNLTAILVGASEEELKEANRRCDLVCRRLRGEDLPADNNVSDRALRRWVALYRQAESTYGCGYVGLLSGISKAGNHTSRLPEATEKEMEVFIEEHVDSLKQMRNYEVWALLKNSCDKKGIIYPSFRVFSKRVREHANLFTRTLKRRGRRAAYQYEPAAPYSARRASPHGDRPWEVGHMDHTEMDLSMRASLTGRSLGRLWMSMMFAANPRRVLGKYLTFDPPSYRSNLMLIRDVVRRFGRLPETLVVDCGADFQSVYFDMLLARFAITKKVRPPSKARFGSPLERMFGTTNTRLFYNLVGNTQLTREVRHVTQDVNPKELAAWTLPRIDKTLDELLFEVYDTTTHPALGQSPREAYIAGMAKTGHRPQRIIPYDEGFLISTLPTTPKGLVKVIPGRGVKINNTYYWSDEFRNPLIENTYVVPRFEPFDYSLAYVFLGDRWVKCYSEYFSIFSGRSEKEIQLASQEIRARDRQHSREGPITAKKLASFLEEVHTEEQFLLQQWRDQELRLVREGFDGEVIPGTPESSQASAGNTSEEPETELPILSETYGEFVA